MTTPYHDACARLGHRLIALRTAASLTQTQLADALGVSRESVQRWEHGRQGLQAALVPTLCKALACTPNDLFASKEPA